MPPHIKVSQNLRAPAVSVVIPAYNAATYIAETLDSVFAQTFSDYEVIVVNDGSPDTEELERVLESYRGRVVYIKQENRGPSGARNAGILCARGHYVALLDSDDLWLPDFLAEQTKVLNANPLLDLIYADAQLFGDSELAGRTFMQTAPSTGAITFESLLRLDCSIITTCVVAHRRALFDAGLFDTNFIRSEDYDLWLRLALRGGQFAYQRKVLARHRLHGSSLASDPTLMFKALIEVYRKIARLPDVSESARNLIVEQIALRQADLALEQGKRNFTVGDYARAAKDIKRANEFFRSRKLQAMLFGLRMAPGLLRRVYLFRQRALYARSAEPSQ